MKLRMLTAAAVLSLSFAGAAYADGAVTAKLAAPVAAKTKVVVAGSVFVCEGSTCVALVAPARALTVASCKSLVKKVGALTAFGGEQKQLSDEDLARCNAAA